MSVAISRQVWRRLARAYSSVVHVHARGPARRCGCGTMGRRVAATGYKARPSPCLLAWVSGLLSIVWMIVERTPRFRLRRSCSWPQGPFLTMSDPFSEKCGRIASGARRLRQRDFQLSFTVRWARLRIYSVNEHDVPPMPQKPPGKGGWVPTTTTRQSARDARADSRSFLEALTESHSAIITIPIW